MIKSSYEQLALKTWKKDKNLLELKKHTNAKKTVFYPTG